MICSSRMSTIWVVITASARDVHAGRLRVPRSGADADEERRSHRRQERPDLRALLARLLGGRLRPRLRRRQRDHRHGGLLPVGRRADVAVGKAPFDFFTEIPGGAGYLFEVVFAGVSLAIVWGAMAERAKLWVYFAFGIWFTITYSIVSHWIWSPHGWLFAKGMQDFAGSTVVHYQGALAALAGALILGPRIGKFGTDGRANPIPGHNIPYAVLGTLILWFGWFGFNPGSTLSVDFGGFGFFAYVATTTNIAAAAGALTGMCVAWVKLGKPDISMMLNGALGALVAITAASGFVAPWAAIADRRRLRLHRRLRRDLRRVDRDRRPDRRRRGARHVRCLGNARDRALRGADPREEPGHRHGRPRLHGLVPPARRSRRSASSPSARSRSRRRSARSS